MVAVAATHLAREHDRVDDHREPRRHQHDVGRRARRVGGALHRDADVRLLEGGGVVDAVARHANRVLPLLQHVDDRELVLGHHLCMGMWGMWGVRSGVT